MFEVLPILDVAGLKWRLIAAWSGLQQLVIDEAIDQWPGRLHACVRSSEMLGNVLNICFDNMNTIFMYCNLRYWLIFV